MQTMIYLSGKSDWDLIKLHNVIGRKTFMKMVKEALRVSVRRYYVPKIVPPNSSIVDLIDKNKVEPIMVSVYFNENKDWDVIDALDRCMDGKKSFFIKQAIRFYFGPEFVLGSILTDTGYRTGKTVTIEGDKISVRKEATKKKEDKKPVEETITVKQTEDIPSESIEEDIISAVTEVMVEDNIINDISNDTENNEEKSPSPDEDDVLSLLSGIIGE